MAKVALSDLTVKNLPLPAKGQRAYWDNGLAGFGVRVSQGGAKTWILLDPRAKVRTQETIGRYPLISLQEARQEAKRRMAEVTLGKHKPRSVGWDKAVAEYLGGIKKKRKDGRIWVVGLGDDETPAFTADGVENLKDLVAMRKQMK